ncbi:hypothetical protein GC105_06645 [Alkalibaculum sp. M08DMB]|uniref:Bacterial Pleckstrin homology domain-containing protein n=1 Tax=Alkalibaculum sporogenes TaxID=2655001 RepID=A0A6A7K7X4_9FIRM|nr:hypothetical protein [Alkalibaculum sporogenes]MPW25462.1 hypothetical protein [Alkalibaculum sporogenes]
MLKSFSGKNKLSKVKIIVSVLIVLGLAGALFLGTRESKISIQGNTVEIGGMYGMSINAGEIQEVLLVNEIPNIRGKINALSLLSLKKGNFRMDEIEKARLYLHAGNGPYIKITTNEEIIIINYKSAEKTESVYEEIQDFSLNKGKSL